MLSGLSIYVRAFRQVRWTATSSVTARVMAVCRLADRRTVALATLAAAPAGWRSTGHGVRAAGWRGHRAGRSAAGYVDGDGDWVADDVPDGRVAGEVGELGKLIVVEVAGGLDGDPDLLITRVTALEMGSRPGPVRDRVAAIQTGFTVLLRSFAATALEQHELPAHEDPDRLAFELHAILLGADTKFVLNDDPATLDLARQVVRQRLGLDNGSNASRN